MTEGLTMPESAEPGAYDIYLAYAEADEDIARAVRAELHRLHPGTRVWCEKQRTGVGDAFNQAADEALAGAGAVAALWTPYAIRSRAFALEARRALTLRKPFLNLAAGTQASQLPQPYAKYPVYEISNVVQLTGRSTGWMPPMRPNQDALAGDINPIAEKVAEYLALNSQESQELADSLIGDLSVSSGTPHTPQYEAVMRAVAPGDPATAIEVMLNGRYSEAEINTLISPQRVRVADMSGDRPEWGAWQVRPQIQQLAPQHKDNGILYAAAGFIAATLGAAALWLFGSTTSAPTSVTAGTPATVASTPSPAATPAATPVALPSCAVTADRAIRNAPCAVRTNISPVPTSPNPQPAATATTACDIEADGRIQNTPCTVGAAYTPPRRLEDTAPPTAPAADCNIAIDNAISTVPCMLRTPLQAPEPVEVPGPARVETVVQREELDACVVPPAGGRIAAGCRLDAPVTAAPQVCNDSYSNTPCVLNQQPRRITSAQTPATNSGTSSGTRPVSATPPATLPPIHVPSNLEPCEEVYQSPCRFTVANAGLNTLTEISESFYGDKDGWCRIYRANERIFNSRDGNPNCIFMTDVLDLPGPTPNNSYGLAGCPPAQPRNQCAAPR